jgi:plastocyanin
VKSSTLRPAFAGGLFLAGIFIIFGLVALVWRGSANTIQPLRTITIKANDVQFDADTVTASVGQPITIRFENDDNMDHALSIDALNVQSDEIKPHQTTSITFTPQKAGTYPFYCPLPGHAALGMVGTLQVVS